MRFSGINMQFSFLPATPCCFQNGATFNGGFIGGGAEMQMWSNWFGRLEYRYADYRSQRLQVFNLNGTPSGNQASMEPTVQTVRVNLAYKFNWAGPVIARY